jgi:predicted nucleic acid-binding protein
VRTHVVDASALYRFLTKEEGALIVADIFKEAAASGTSVLMSAVNWGEVYYTLVKRIGLTKADAAIASVQDKAPIQLIEVTPEDAVRAGRLKAQYNLPYADAFAAALTGNQRVLVTADVAHFERVPKLRLLKLPRANKT